VSHEATTKQEARKLTRGIPCPKCGCSTLKLDTANGECECRTCGDGIDAEDVRREMQEIVRKMDALAAWLEAAEQENAMARGDC
jgi:transcription elongation factor Elf1